MSNKKDRLPIREKEEVKEGKSIIDNDLPENRVQDTQQVATTDDAIKTEAADSSFSKKSTKGKGSELKTEKVSEILTGSSVNSGMGFAASGRSVSGTGGGVLGANNSTPQAEKSRSNSRVGKKLDRTATKLNYTPSEQAILEVDESKPLADSADIDQGYNGTYRNENARSQKMSGAVPADLMYQRSVDFIAKDKLYFVEGQMNFQTGDSRTSYYPSHRIVIDENGKPKSVPVEYNLGNYLHRGLHFGLDQNGKVKSFYADVEDLTASDLTPEDANGCSAHRLIKANVAELDRMSMDAKAGDEKADIWSPLPRAIDEPTKAAALMSSFEAETGAYVHLAYSKATTNFAFQLNRGPKDGLDEIGPGIDNLIGWRTKYTNSASVTASGGNAIDRSKIFNAAAYRKGDPAILIDAYDSVNKYHNKADLLLQPRGFRMHLQTADNNMNPLRVPKEYANVYAATEVFSTIDHEYDPLLPVCITDKANLILAHNLNETCAFNNEIRSKVNLGVTYETMNGYAYDEEVLVDKAWMERLNIDTFQLVYKASFDDEDTDHQSLPTYSSETVSFTPKGKLVGTVKAEYEIRVILDPDDATVAPTGYTLLGSGTIENLTDNVVIQIPKPSANKVTERTVSRSVMRVTYRLGGEYGYKYSDLRNNYIMEVKHPLVNGLIAYLENAIGAKFYSLLQDKDLEDTDEFYVPLVFSTRYATLAQFLICAATPWILRVRENSFKDVIYYEDNVHEYPYQKLASLKDVPFKNYVNFDYSDYDTQLQTKVMNPVQSMRWVMPEFFWKVDTGMYVLPWYFNEVDLNTDGTVNEDASNMSMPSIRSGIRLGLLDNFYGMSEKDIRLATDRLTKYLLKDDNIQGKYAYKYGSTTDGQIAVQFEVGYDFTIKQILTCPRELGLEQDALLGVLTLDPAGDETDVTSVDFSDNGISSSYRIDVYTNSHNEDEHPDILSPLGVNIQRGSNYVQKWYRLFANNATSNTDVLGLVFGMGDDVPEYSPFADLDDSESAGLATKVISYQRSMNTRLQFLPFVISPFDANFTGTYTHDIYDIAYMFGLCGFRASDYRESVYNREKRVVNEGLLFISDPWVEDSPIISGAQKSTGVKMSVGYEI